MLPSVLEVVWFILPAWVANSAAIDVSKLPVLKNFNTPMDFGRTWRGKRILGDGKTWRGFICGVLVATFVAYLQSIYPQPNLYKMTPFLGFLMGVGALTGDVLESFGKRRLGLKRGHPVFGFDHLDYIFGAFVFAWILIPIDVGYLLMSCLITVPVHFFANIVAWILKLKDKPW